MFSTALKELPPFGEAVGMVLEENDPGPGISVLLPGHPRLANDESDQVFHTGAILAIIDNSARTRRVWVRLIRRKKSTRKSKVAIDVPST